MSNCWFSVLGWVCCRYIRHLISAKSGKFAMADCVYVADQRSLHRLAVRFGAGHVWHVRFSPLAQTVSLVLPDFRRDI